MIKPMLACGELRLVGATTLDEYRKYIEKDAALERRFQQVLVGEPSVEDTVGILRGLKDHATRCITACRSPTRPWWPPRRCRIATSRHDSCRTRPSTSSTRPHPGCAWRSTRGPSRSTKVERLVRRLEIEEMALAKETDDASRDRLERSCAANWPTSGRSWPS